MTAELTPADLELLTGSHYATVVTMNPDDTPHATVTWIDAADGHVLVNTAEGRTKARNLRRDPRVAVLVQDHPYRWISITGTVVAAETGPEAEAHIDALSRRYDGTPWRFVEGQVRVRFRIRPDRIIRYG
jgi:PPOX class probable F420-dependent enzyme